MDSNSAFFDIPQAPSQGAPVPEHICSGAFCEIWRIDRAGRFRALKCLRRELRGDALHESLLRKEFEIGYNLSHPHICEYYSFRSVEGLGSCIEMEWVDGRTFEEMIVDGKPDAALCDKILDEILEALGYMHAKGVLHRDLKPSNILVSYNGDSVKLIDFGLSDSGSHSILKTSAGTALYTAPEVLAGAPCSVRSDIWSVGLLVSALGSRHRAVARKCCERRPQLRYASAAEVRKALHSKSPLYSGIAFIALAVLCLALPLLDRHDSGKGKPGLDAEGVLVQDSTSATVLTPSSSLTEDGILPGQDSPAISLTAAPDSISTKSNDAAKGSMFKQAAKPNVTRADKPSKAEEVPKAPVSDAEALDELFRQASELFE